ncbi:MAG: glycerol-3-phosphate dehydrogenase/oxidase [Myxococcales bacterium]|jgi:glycerol-3-phosphate dehydrogenase|nr:glycerol-3-phosphate dehydrogenase/oxidase [Myxococcales bacterium]
MWTRGWRDEVWSRLDQEWDVIIVGGGITGVGILGEATRGGKKALLVEGNDFAYGTSSRSTKLVHGGLRYLRQGQFLVTRKSVKERERLMREAPGLVTNLGFSLATFPGDKIPRWMYGMGLIMYDALAWKWAHERETKEGLEKRLPPLVGSGVLGGYHYFDAQTDDTRLVMRVVREAVSEGGTAINYARADSLLRDSTGKVHGVVVRDVAPGERHGRTAEVKAKVVINATGAWADDLRQKIGKDARMRKIRGSHLTFPRERMPIGEAVSLLHPGDGRAVFAVPWEGVTIFGTTDKDHPESLDTEPAISDEEVEYLMVCARRAFPALELQNEDIVSSWAGVRPVINTGAKDPSKESREHAVWREDGLLTIAGGKLTTFALMARDALAAVEDVLGPLAERTFVFEPEDGAAERLPKAMSDADKVRVLGRYGPEAPDVFAREDLMDGVGGSIATYAELEHAARAEGVVKLEDLLLRRTRVGLLVPHGGKAEMSRIRAVAQPALGWTDDEWAREEADYEKTWRAAYAGRQ